MVDPIMMTALGDRRSSRYIEIEEPDIESAPQRIDSRMQTRKSPASSIFPKDKHESFDLSGTTFLISSDGSIISLPIPSQSPYDPLNWGWWKRVVALFSIGFFSFTGIVLTQGTSNLVKGLMKDFPPEESGPFTVETLIIAPTLFMGIGAFIWIPLSIALGRKRVFLLAAVTMLICTIVAGVSTNFYELLACVAGLGFAQGFSLSVAFLMVIDLTFIHQRPVAIAAVWSIAGFCGSATLSVVPFITEHGLEWHRFYQIWTVPAVVALVLAIFCYPETYFKRPTIAFDGRIILQSATEKLTMYEEDKDNSDAVSFVSMNSNKDLPSVPTRSRFGMFIDQYWIPRNKATSWTAMLAVYPQIFFCLINPLVFWVLLFTAVNFGGMMYIGATFPRVLSRAPYNLPSTLIINVNNGAALGALLSFPVAGPLVCWFTKRASKRNRGVLEAEHYLIGYIIPIVTGVISTLLYGLAVHNSWHFSVYYISYFFNALSFTSLGIVNTIWVTEAFPRWAAAAICVVGGGSYLASTAMSLTVIPWIKAHGYLLVGIEFTVLQTVLGLVVLPMAFWGKKARQSIHGRWINRREGALRPQ